jgi:glycosyltransferase involved in cell wall biosynthesis
VYPQVADTEMDGDEELSTAPRLTVGLPVYNGEKFLAQSLDALLGQSYQDFELLISDNTSTDETARICAQYQAQDPRIRYFRQPRNIGCAPNHNFLVGQARGEFFKWASDDDLYAFNLLERCVDALDEHPDAVLAHSFTAIIDDSGDVIKTVRYSLNSAAPTAPQRFRSVLFDRGGDDDGAVIRTRVLRQTALNGSYYRADRTFVAELALYGPFYQVPDWLYFRRDHPARAARAFSSVRGWCSNLDPRRADRLRNPVLRLYGEYIWGFISAIRRAPLTPAERRACYGHLIDWAKSRAFSEHGRFATEQNAADVTGISVEAVVAGQGRV